MRVRATVTAVALLTLAGVGAQAQSPIEMGVDAQVSFGLDDQPTTINIPEQKIRAGFMLTPVMTVEPSLGFFRMSKDGSSISGTKLDVSLLYHFSPSRAARQFYLRPVVGLHHSSFTNSGTDLSDSNTDLNFGVAGGMKIPLMERLGARFEAEFRNYMTDPSTSAINLNVGLSYFTR